MFYALLALLGFLDLCTGAAINTMIKPRPLVHSVFLFETPQVTPILPLPEVIKVVPTPHFTHILPDPEVIKVVPTPQVIPVLPSPEVIKVVQPPKVITVLDAPRVITTTIVPAPEVRTVIQAPAVMQSPVQVVQPVTPVVQPVYHPTPVVQPVTPVEPVYYPPFAPTPVLPVYIPTFTLEKFKTETATATVINYPPPFTLERFETETATTTVINYPPPLPPPIIVANPTVTLEKFKTKTETTTATTTSLKTYRIMVSTRYGILSKEHPESGDWAKRTAVPAVASAVVTETPTSAKKFLTLVKRTDVPPATEEAKAGVVPARENAPRAEAKADLLILPPYPSRNSIDLTAVPEGVIGVPPNGVDYMSPRSRV